ncbi:hypothetical protein [Streptomyces sp. MMG1121]|nr:hypothetical protein [Streptomyces sp. MMG1121]
MTATTEHNTAKPEPTGSDTEATEPAAPDDDEHQDEGATASLGGYLLLIG